MGVRGTLRALVPVVRLRDVVLVLSVVASAGCPEGARDDLRQAAAALEERDVAKAGAKLEQAAEKTNEVVEEKLEVVADGAKDAASAARAIIDPDAADREAAAAISCKGTRCTIARPQYDEWMSNPLLFVSQIEVSPHESKAGRRVRIDKVREGSACALLGLQESDVISKINGRKIGYPPPSSLLDDLRKAKRVTLELERGGKKVRRVISRA